jgi:PAS domain S-box-containing protein
MPAMAGRTLRNADRAYRGVIRSRPCAQESDVVQLIPTSRPPRGSADTDPALAAVRGLVGAAGAPVAVFDARGDCLVANPAFVLHAAHYGDGGHAAAVERRTPFSPDGVRTWTLASVAEEAAQPRTAAFVDVVANALPIMFNAKDAQGRYLFMNRYQAELYGVAPGEAVGRTASDLLGATYGGYTGAIDAEVRRTGVATPFYEETYAGVDGRVRQWLTSKVPLIGASGAVWGTATVAVDITERKQLEERLREAKEQAEAGSRAKSRFLANMSHELRTPLNAVIGFAEIMREEVAGPLGAPEYREYAGLIHQSGMALLDLITNLLDFARVEAGGLELAVGDVEVMRLLRSVAAVARAEAAAAGIAKLASLEVEPTTGTLGIRADEQRLRQIVRALIGNALKFTPPAGRVTVRARKLPDGWAEMVVEDSGIGMSPSDLEQAFDPFWQADSGLGRTRPGAGIGLKLARQLAALHGGRLTLESEAGQGTRAILLLPPAPPPRPAA